MRRLLLVVVMVISWLVSSGQPTNSVFRSKEHAFGVGEKATYNIYFKLGFIWIHAGVIDFECTQEEKAGRECYRMNVIGRTCGAMEKFYVIRDTLVSYIDKETLEMVEYEDYKHEDSYYSHTKSRFEVKGDSLLVKYHRVKRNKEIDKQFVISRTMFDLVGTCYLLRNLNTERLEREEVVPFEMLFEDEVYKLGLKFKGKKNIKTKSGEKYRTLYFVPKLIKGDVFKNEDDMGLYVSDDSNHVPIYVEGRLKIGSAVASLVKVEHTKRPMGSK